MGTQFVIKRKEKELYWMYKLKTSATYGLNERDVCEAF